MATISLQKRPPYGGHSVKQIYCAFHNFICNISINFYYDMAIDQPDKNGRLLIEETLLTKFKTKPYIRGIDLTRDFEPLHGGSSSRTDPTLI